jgi:hypothetical protein
VRIIRLCLRQSKYALLLTLWCRTVLEHLRVTQQVDKISAVMEPEGSLPYSQKERVLNLIRRHLFHSIILTSVQILLSPLRIGLSINSFFLSNFNQNSVLFPLFSHVCCMFCPSHSPRFIPLFIMIYLMTLSVSLTLWCGMTG